MLEEFYKKANQPKKINKKKLKNLKGLAEGGPIKKDEPVIVGEEGPELIVPNTDGLVIPNDVLENSTEIMNNVVQSMEWG